MLLLGPPLSRLRQVYGEISWLILWSTKLMLRLGRDNQIDRFFLSRATLHFLVLLPFLCLGFPPSPVP